jgi:N-acetylglucosaminyl-diphospho-decaprenol L-rhamnosyltransferase
MTTNPTDAAERVTIVVASRNRRSELLASIPRHLALPERPRVIVVDDASTDGTAEALAAELPQVDVIRLPASLGGAARNAGVRAASSPYVAFSDDDAWWQPGALHRATELLDAHPRLAVVQAHILVGPQERDDPTCELMRTSRLPSSPGQPGHPILSFIACAVVVRRAAFLSQDGFCARLGTGGEEQLLSWDLVGAGWQLSYIPEILAHHHPPPTPDGRPGRREATLRNALWTEWLRRPWPAAARSTVATLAHAPRDRTTARAVRRAIAGCGWVLRARRVNPRHVEQMYELLGQ